jgi:hypothetical protein
MEKPTPSMLRLYVYCLSCVLYIVGLIPNASVLTDQTVQTDSLYLLINLYKPEPAYNF